MDLDLSAVEEVVLFFIISLFLGSLIRGLKKIKIGMPYSPVILGLGLLIGWSVRTSGDIPDSKELLARTNPEGILLIFLPILIFESAFNSDWHVFKRSIYQIVALAGVGVILSCLLVAVVMKLILRYNDEELPWSGALTLGAIVSATDPIAVVALLRELGANIYFSIIIEGDSLVNDGTAIVLFNLFHRMTRGEEAAIGDVIEDFVISVFGGIGLGLFVGVFTSFCLQKIHKDAVLAISIIFVANYLVLFISNNLAIDISGILGLVAMGLYMSARGRLNISRYVVDSLHAVVSWTQYAAETIIFLWTGLIIGVELISGWESTITASDWGKLIAFFFLTILIRALVIAILSPLLKKGYPKLNWKEYLVLSYSDLKGALGLVLGLIVSIDESLKKDGKDRMGQLILFYIAGLSALSLLIKGMTAKLLVKGIGMIQKNPATDQILRNMLRELDVIAKETFAQIREENETTPCNWAQVTHMTITDETSFLLPSNVIEDEAIIAETRQRLLQRFTSIAWAQYYEGGLLGTGANLLERAVKINQENIEQHIKLFEILYNSLVRPFPFKIYASFSKFPIIGRYFKDQIAEHFVLICDVSRALVNIIDEIKEHVEDFPLPNETINLVLEEFTYNQQQARAYLEQFEIQFTEIISFITTKRFTLKILNEQKKFILHRLSAQKIENREADKLLDKLYQKFRDVRFNTKYDFQLPKLFILTIRYPLLNLVSAEQLKRLTASSRIVKLKASTFLLQQGEPFPGLYLILEGEAEVIIGNKTFRKIVGNIISFSNLLNYNHLSKVTAICKTDVKAQLLDKQTFSDIILTDRRFLEQMIMTKFQEMFYLAHNFNERDIPPSGIDLKNLASQCEICHFKEGDLISIFSQGLLITGKLKVHNEEYTPFWIVKQENRPLQALEDGILVKFSMKSCPSQKNTITIG